MAPNPSYGDCMAYWASACFGGQKSVGNGNAGGGERSPQQKEGDAQADAAKSQQQVQSLQRELAKSQFTRRKSNAEISRSLAEVGTKLEVAESALTPWGEIKTVREQLGTIQQAIAQHMDDAEQELSKLQQGGALQAPGFFAGSAAKEITGQEAELQKEIAANQQQRRSSLSEVSREIASLSDRLETAEASWAPWSDMVDAKHQLGHMRQIVAEDGEQNGSAEQGDKPREA